MDLTLNDNEIKEAIVNYVSANGVNTSGKAVKVTIVTGRKNSGSKAEVVISDADVEVAAEASEENVTSDTIEATDTQDATSNEVKTETEEDNEEGSLFSNSANVD